MTSGMTQVIYGSSYNPPGWGRWISTGHGSRLTRRHASLVSIGAATPDASKSSVAMQLAYAALAALATVATARSQLPRLTASNALAASIASMPAGHWDTTRVYAPAGRP